MSDRGRPLPRAHRSTLLLVTLAGALAACDPTVIFVDSSGRIELQFGDVSWDAQVVTVENRGADTIFHFLVEQETVAVIEWVPCVDADPGTCPQVAPGASARIPYDEIAGYSPGDSAAVFFWWTRANTSPVAESLQLAAAVSPPG